MPNTVIGISEPNSDSAPYLPSKLFSVAITNTILICVIKLLIPNIETFLTTFFSNLNCSFVNFIDLNLFMYAILITNVNI